MFTISKIEVTISEKHITEDPQDDTEYWKMQYHEVLDEYAQTESRRYQTLLALMRLVEELEAEDFPALNAARELIANNTQDFEDDEIPF